MAVSYPMLLQQVGPCSCLGQRCISYIIPCGQRVAVMYTMTNRVLCKFSGSGRADSLCKIYGGLLGELF